MSLTVNMKMNFSPKNQIGKVLAGNVTYNCLLKGPTSILSPVLVVETDEDLSMYNYMEITQFHRSYFIDDIVSLNNKIWEIHAHVDVLETYADAIKGNNAVINKQENMDLVNKYLNDGSFVSQVDEFNTSYNFPGGFNDSPVYILICAGG